jgi:hypothetical protein
MNEQLENLIKQAKTVSKHDWPTFELMKTQVIKWSKSDMEYEEAIRRLINILEV